jgi:hypothetical protein
MEYLNDMLVDGNLHANNLLTTKNIVYSKDIGNEINDIALDFSVCQNYTIDLRGATYVGANPTIQVGLTGGSVINSQYKVRILQHATLPANLTINLTSASTIQNEIIVESVINIANSVTTVIFDYVADGAAGVYVPINISSNSSGYVENTDYSSTAIITDGDTYTSALSKLDEILGKLIPARPAYLSERTLAVNQTPTTLYKLSDGVSVSVITSAEPTLTLSGSFYNTGGSIVSTINSVVDGIIDLSTATLSNLSLAITKSTENNGFYDVIATLTINTANKSGGALTNSESVHTVVATHDDGTARSSNTVSLRKCLYTAFPVIANPINGVFGATVPTKYVSGLLALNTGDTFVTAASYQNVTYNNGSNQGYYASKVGELSGTSIATTNAISDAITFAEMITYSPNTPQLNTTATILANKFEDGLTVIAKSASPRGLSVGTSITLNGSNQKYLVDSVTSVSAALPYEYDHSVSLLTNDRLMILNGVVQYPSGDRSSYYGGLNYSAITGYRKLVSKSIAVAGYSRIRITLPTPIGFTGAIEATNYQMTVVRSDKPTETYNGNAAYDGVGVVQNGEGCLLLADSTASQKVITFGEVLPAGATAIVTISINSTAKSFGQGITYVAY